VTTLRVATLNLYYHLHNRWREGQPPIAQGPEVLRLDLVALQEVDRLGDGDHAVAGSRLRVLRAREPTCRTYPRL
jgi:endonuclease/exonuclease/phosphatase family metal-dependent hydrolase